MSTNGNGKAPRVTNAAVLTALNNFEVQLDRLRFAQRAGLQYEGARDLYKLGGYPRTLGYAEFRAMYDEDGIAGQIVDMPADTTWRNPPEIVEAGKEDAKTETAFEKAWKELAAKLGVWGEFQQADVFARIGRYSVVVIGAGASDDAALAQPLPAVDIGEVAYLSSYEQPYATIKTFTREPRDPNFGLPETYELDLSKGGSSVSGITGKLIVHYTRVLHLTEGPGRKVYGRPVLQRVFNRLMDLQKISTSTAEAFWLRVDGPLVGSIDKDVTNADEVREYIAEQMKLMAHDLLRGLVAQGFSLERLAGTEPNPKEAANLYMTLIAAGAGIPKRMLFGSETGERASSEDQKTFLGSIAERQKQHAEPQFVRAFVDRLIDRGALPRPTKGYEVVWPKMFEESELDVAETSRRNAEAAAKQTPVGGDPTLLTWVDEEGRLWIKERKPEDPSPFADLDMGPQIPGETEDEPGPEGEA